MQKTVDRKRFYLVMIISGAILLVWQLFFAPPPPPPGDKQTAENGVVGREDSAAQKSADHADSDGAEQAQQPAVSPDDAPVKVRDIALREDTLAGTNLKISLINKEASVTSARIIEPEQYAGTGPEDKPGDLIGFPADAPQYPFRIDFVGKGLSLPEGSVYEVVESASEKSSEGVYSKLVYRYEDPRGGYRIDKTFKVDPVLPYVINMDVAITNTASQGRLDDTMAVDILRWNNPDAKSSFLDFQPIEVAGVCRTTDDIEREGYKSLAKDGTITHAEFQSIWGAVDTRYFMLAAIPAEPADSCEYGVVGENYVRTRLTGAPFSVKAGETVTLSNQLFLGPKDVDVLSEIRKDLTESVDYGIFAFVARPMRWALNELFKLVGNWGLAIILLTFIIRGLLWPVNMKAYSSMERMKSVQPILAEIKEKYKDDEQRQTEETMKAFKKHNVSPAGGCLPMILQMPVLYGFYVTIYNSVDLYNASFVLWYTDLATPDPYYVLPILMGVSMFFQQRLSTVDTSNKQAAMMMKVMPVMMTAFFLVLPSGLVLYYALSTVIGVVQQYFIRRKFAKEPVLVSE